MEGYFFTADLLGFSNLVNNLEPEDLIARVDSWVSLVAVSAKKCSLARYQLLSDTLFVGADAKKDDLRNIISLARMLLQEGLDLLLPIRGAVSYGTYEWKNLVYGEAVIKAHSLEVLQEWVGVSCVNNLPHVDAFWGLDSLICFPVPKKSGPIELHPVVGWDVPLFDALVRKLVQGGLTHPKESLEWEWGRKAGNTAEFGVYRRVLQTKNEDGRIFRGRLPVEGFEAIFKDAKLIP